jgi:Amt family ammonium transporter
MESFGEVQYILNSFLLIFGGVLVMWMAAGFAMLEAGLTRTKNTAVILTKNMGILSISSVVYFLIGFNVMYGGMSGLMFGGMGSDFAGGGDYGIGADFFFQVMFVATAASIISGTVAERMKVLPFFIFVAVLAAFIYPMQGAWTWGGGWLAEQGFSDFAGSTIVHSVGGWAALAAVLLLGARAGKYTKEGRVRALPGSNLPLATLGTFILWMGWFGFNGGSQLAMGTAADVDAVAMIMASTHIGASAGAVAALILTKVLYKKIDLTFVLNGALAGLVSVTAGPDLGIGVALIEGAIGGVLVILAVSFFDKLRIDDPVGALSVHLVAGIWGTLAVGIFNSEVSIVSQLIGIVSIGAFVFVASGIVWYILKLTMGIRVSEKEEHEGLDLHETGLEAYPEFIKNAK